MQKKKIKALGLLSGGLDSILAIKLIEAQGIEVTGLSFSSHFFGAHLAEKAAKVLKIPLLLKDITREHFEIVKNPAHGYGKTMNPCIDCHGLMLKFAGRIMEEKFFDFIFTGEVLNERPMSQTKDSLDLVAKLSGYEKFILRPLSAKLLPPTESEHQGLIDRNKLLDINGRSRKRQLALAKQFCIKEYPNPAGGCLLTDIGFSKRLKDLFTYVENSSLSDIELLKVGRHFRLSRTAKLIVGRDQKENEVLEKLGQKVDFVFSTENVPGPVCVLRGTNLEEVLNQAALICASYSDAEHGAGAEITIKSQDESKNAKFVVDKKNRCLDKII